MPFSGIPTLCCSFTHLLWSNCHTSVPLLYNLQKKAGSQKHPTFTPLLPNRSGQNGILSYYFWTTTNDTSDRSQTESPMSRQASDAAHATVCQCFPRTPLPASCFSPQSRSHRSKGVYFLENDIVFQKVGGVAAVAAAGWPKPPRTARTPSAQSFSCSWKISLSVCQWWNLLAHARVTGKYPSEASEN